MSLDELRRVLRGITDLDVEARAVLGTHEASQSRVMTLEHSYVRLSGLSIQQDELFRESLRAVESKLFRAAHVLAWAGFIDFLHSYLVPSHLAVLQEKRPKWNLCTAEDLRDCGEFAVITAGKDAGVYNNTTMKALHGLLNRRNECAHPSDYFPDLNESLGYIGELFKRIEQLHKAG